MLPSTPFKEEDLAGFTERGRVDVAACAAGREEEGLGLAACAAGREEDFYSQSVS